MKIYLTFICRDNKDTIAEMIESCLSIIDGIIVCDTGSVDDTLDIIKRTHQSYICEIPLHIFHDEWVNFGHNRTLMMEHARSIEDADYLLVMDTDEILIIESDFSKEDINADCVMINTPDEHYTYPRDRIFSNKILWKWIGAAHEYPVSEKMQSKSLAKNLNLKLRPKPAGYVKHIERNLKLLKEDFEKNPNDARTLFYIGLSYRDLRNFEKAKEYLMKRYNMENTWDEERWYSLYVTAKINEAERNIETSETLYLKAYEFRPTRAEPLFHISRMLYQNGQRNKAIMYMDMAFQKKLPQGDSVFVEERIYHWECKFELSHMYYYDDNTRDLGYKYCLELIEEKEKLNIPQNILDKIYDNTRLYDNYYISVGKPKRFIIELPKGYDGLGDHFYYSHLPGIIKTLYPKTPVFISKFNTYKTPGTKEIVWENNPFLDKKNTEVDALGTYRDMNALNLVMRNNNQILGMSMMDQIAIFYGLNPSMGHNAYQECIPHCPNIELEKLEKKTAEVKRINDLKTFLKDKVVFDGNFKHYAGVTIKQINEYFNVNNIKVDYQIAPFNGTNYLKLDNVELVTFESVFDYYYCMDFMSKFYSLMTGTCSIAVGKGIRISVFVGQHNLKNYMFRKILHYIDLPIK